MTNERRISHVHFQSVASKEFSVVERKTNRKRLLLKYQNKTTIRVSKTYDKCDNYTARDNLQIDMYCAQKRHTYGNCRRGVEVLIRDQTAPQDNQPQEDTR